MGTPVLYILMRNDMNSLNAGKAMAQASHASNAFVDHMRIFTEAYNEVPAHLGIETESVVGFESWKNATPQAFGTVLVLAAKMPEIKTAVDIFIAMGYVAGVIHDPTYPIVDGEVVHYIPLDTCAYVFVPNKEDDGMASVILKRFPLHP
jgi:hypothetical protein